jgi:hypothetical protein
MCNICWNVVTAYQKSLVASQAIRHYWATMVQTELPLLELRETEEIRLEPYTHQSKTKKEAAKSLTVLDFLVSRRDPKLLVSTPLFHVEQKAGPGSIEEMKEFQLDVNDFDDILAAAQNTGLPAYVFHVQLGLEFVKATRRVVTHRIWWTDILRLKGAFKSVKGRRGEDKQAAYFKPEAFQPIDLFLSELRQERYRSMAEQLNAL